MMLAKAIAFRSVRKQTEASLEQIQKMTHLSAKGSVTALCLAAMMYFAEAQSCFVEEDLHPARSKKAAAKKIVAKHFVQIVLSPTALSLFGYLR